ncbi:hypothetical protein [Microcoleus sp. B4-D4]|uniref:hypothetical protein n=1 Tax=Microcoleus sp. B4-D4 TaxID=2818667 RepID=UPI002FD26348
MPAELKDASVEVVVVVEHLPFKEAKPKYNAWGKLTTKKSLQAGIARMLKLQQEIALNKSSIGQMIGEVCRF